MKIKIKDFLINIKLSFILLVITMIALDMTGQFFIVLSLVILHEICHIIVAKCYGAKCSELIITPAGLCAKIDLDKLSYFQKLSVLFAGPLFNIAFGIAFGNMASIILGVFNLIPVYPLDGGKIIGYVVGYTMGTLRANRYLTTFSLIICCFLLILSTLQMSLYIGNISLLIISIFLFRTNKRYSQMLAYNFYKSLIHKPNNKTLKIKTIMVNKNTTLKTIIYRLGSDYYTMICIRDGNSINTISEDYLQSFILDNGISYTAKDLINS